MARLGRHLTQRLAAGGLAATTLALALLTSCASRPLVTPTAPIIAPTPTPVPAPTSAEPGSFGSQPWHRPYGPGSGAEPKGRPGSEPPRETPLSTPGGRGAGGGENRRGQSPETGAGPVQPPRSPLSPDARRLPTGPRLRLTAADGYIADGEGLSPFATDQPAVGNLDPKLLAAVQQASIDTARNGVELLITSGWRSVRYQQVLLDAAIGQYGNEAEARRRVSTPERSAHVTGRAVDIGPAAAQFWLRQHGNRYGLCQIYVNEPWHYELATQPGGICPPLIEDASTR